MNYLPNNVTTQPDAVEEYFCKPLDKETAVRLSDEQAEMFIQLSLTEMQPTWTEKSDEVEKDAMKLQAFAIVKTRSEVMGLKLSTAAKLFLAGICDRPGLIVMYLYFLAYRAKIKSVREINMSTLGQDLIPWGIPSEESFETAWTKQKVEGAPGTYTSGNLLDYPAASQSLFNW